MRGRISKFVIGAAVLALGMGAVSPVQSAQETQEAAPIILRQPAIIASWPTTCDPAKLQYVFPAKTTRDVCGGKGVLVGPGWWWRAWPGLVSGGSHYLSVYDAPTAPSSASKAQFFPTIGWPGYYDIWVSWRTTHNRADETPFWIFPDDRKTYKMFVNEKGPEGFRAVKLGNFFLGRHAKNKAIVEMRNDEGTHSKGIDGVFFKYTGPKNPGILTATQEQFGDRVELNWKQQAGDLVYRIYRGTTTSVKDAKVVGIVRVKNPAPTPMWVDGALAEGQSYNYWIRTVGKLRKVSRRFSNMATGSTGVVPAAPLNVTATPGAPADPAEPVVVKWNPVATATSYAVYRADVGGVEPGTPVEVGSVNAENPPPVQYQFSDANVAAGGEYEYHVTARLAQMESPASAVAPVIVPVP